MESPGNHLKACLFSLVIIGISLISWEYYLRNKGYQISYDDGKEFWAHERSKVYQHKDKITVFIGSSRIKYDLDSDIWMTETGERPIQLACVGSTPISVLADLAADEKFKGKLIIDVTEKLFFNFDGRPYDRPNAGIKYIEEETYAQKAS